MIIVRYLIKETLKSQIAILFILILIFFSQKIINILSLIIYENIPSSLMLPLVGLGVPKIIQLILPLSLFLGLLITYGKLYTSGEIIAMFACGLGKYILVLASLVLALFTTIIALINVAWILPYLAKYQEQVVANAKANPSLTTIVERQFKTTKDKNLVLYVGNIKGNNFTNIFMAQVYPSNNQRPFVVIAKNGHIQEKQNGNQIITLNNGIRYEGISLLNNLRITKFKFYQATINYKKIAIKGNKIEQKNMSQLWFAADIKSRAEFHWRITLVAAVLIMALMVVPLSQANQRQGQVLNILPAMSLYLIFFLLQSVLHFNAEKIKIDPMITMWLVNIIFLSLAIILNIWNTSLTRAFRANFTREVSNV